MVALAGQVVVGVIVTLGPAATTVMSPGVIPPSAVAVETVSGTPLEVTVMWAPIAAGSTGAVKVIVTGVASGGTVVVGGPASATPPSTAAGRGTATLASKATVCKVSMPSSRMPVLAK